MRHRCVSPRSPSSKCSRLSLALFAGTLLAPLSFATPADAGEGLYGSRESFWQGQVGMRSTFITNPGFDPFASNNVLSAFSLGVTRTIFEQDAFSLAPGVFWDYGARSGVARGQPTTLDVHRLAVALEGRYHFVPWAYALVRVAPGALHQSAELHDPLAAAPYVARAWTFALDASAGAAFLLGPHATASASPARWWLGAEGGYGYADGASLMMHPDLRADDPRRTGALDLGRLALGGGFFRIYGSVTF